jgi:hypothetical protein
MSSRRPVSNRTVGALVVLFATVTVLQVTVFVLSFNLGAEDGPQVTGHATGTSPAGIVGFFWIPINTCEVPLTTGWSLVSLCRNTSNTSIGSVMSGIDYRFIMRWNDQTQSFDVYSPLAASPPFTTMEFNTSYFVNLNSADTQIMMTGIEVPDINISMVQGWNGPGYPYYFNTTILKYFNATRHRYLMKWNASSQEFVIYSPRAAVPTFINISAGEGQMVNSYAVDQLSYNKTYLKG